MAGPVYTSAGEEFVNDILDGGANDIHTMWVAWGSGTTGPLKNQTALVTEEKPVRTEAGATQESADLLQWVGTLTATGDNTITEVGLFTDSLAATMLIRSTHSAIPVANLDAVEYTISLQQS